jgi:hypothetical protein
LEINKTVIVASSWCSIFTLPTLMMHGQTQIKFDSVNLSLMQTPKPSCDLYEEIKQVNVRFLPISIGFYRLLLLSITMNSKHNDPSYQNSQKHIYIFV